MFFSFWPRLNEFSRTQKEITADLIAGITVAIVALPLAIDLIWGMAIGIAFHLLLVRIKVERWKA